MNVRKIRLLFILVICLALTPISAFASSAAITLNELEAVEQGGTVTVSGTSILSEVIVQVVRPGNSTLYYDIVDVIGGQFSSTFTLASTESAGMYKIVAGQGSQVDTKDLKVTARPNVVPPCTTGCTPPPPVITGPGAGPSPTPVPAAGGPNANTGNVGVDTSKNVVTSITAPNGQVTTTSKQDAEALTAAFTAAAKQRNGATAPTVEIAFDNKAGEAVVFSLPSSVLASTAANAPGTAISFRTNDSEYVLPIDVINYAAIAQSMGSTVEDIDIQVTITEAAPELNRTIREKAQALGITQVGLVVEYAIHATSNGNMLEINDFGTTYVSRTIEVELPDSPDHATVALYHPVTGEFSFVPAVFEQQADGTYKVTFKRNGNSTYTVLSSAAAFDDVTTHWAKADIELLASKLIVKGVTDSSFAPENEITRAEFAALLVRSLGLSDREVSTAFHDVTSSDWFAGAVSAAVKAQLVDGFDDNRFQPNAAITREQMAVMVSRAIRAAGIVEAPANAASQTLDKFDDKKSISSWAQDAVAQAVEAKIITGMPDLSFDPSANASRSQAAVMLKRLLQYTSFMN